VPLPFGARGEYATGVVTDLAEIRRLGAEREAENIEFRRYVAEHHLPVEPFQILAGEIQRQVDCTACANCCRYSVVNVSPPEIADIARHLELEPDDVVREYTAPDPEDSHQRILRSTRDGCVFLDGTLCMVYPARPKSCRDFPHLTPGTHSLGGRVSSLCRWASLCPIVYNAIESYKHLVGYHPHSRAHGA
jgi:Fe-S-cluster containining protein